MGQGVDRQAKQNTTADPTDTRKHRRQNGIALEEAGMWNKFFYLKVVLKTNSVNNSTFMHIRHRTCEKKG